MPVRSRRTGKSCKPHVNPRAPFWVCAGSALYVRWEHARAYPDLTLCVEPLVFAKQTVAVWSAGCPRLAW